MIFRTSGFGGGYGLVKNLCHFDTFVLGKIPTQPGFQKSVRNIRKGPSLVGGAAELAWLIQGDEMVLPSVEHIKRNLGLFRVKIRGSKTTQSCGKWNKTIIRILIKQPSIMESKRVLFVAQLWIKAFHWCNRKWLELISSVIHIYIIIHKHIKSYINIHKQT